VVDLIKSSFGRIETSLKCSATRNRNLKPNFHNNNEPISPKSKTTQRHYRVVCESFRCLFRVDVERVQSQLEYSQVSRKRNSRPSLGLDWSSGFLDLRNSVLGWFVDAV
jgi:hypothetical protein